MMHVSASCTPSPLLQALNEREKLAAPERIEAMIELVRGAQEREQQLQERFRGLATERDELLAALSAAAAAARG